MRARLLPALLLAAAASACGVDPSGNAPPVTAPDTAVTDEDVAVELDVLANDVDPDGDPLTVRTASADGHEVTIANGRVRVVPAADFHGAIEVRYQIDDGDARVPGTATVTVRPVNDAPVARAATVTTGRNGALELSLAADDVDGDPVTVEVVGAPAHGTLAGDGPRRTYTPARDYVGADEVRFVARDGQLTSAPATVAITVAAGQQPVAAAQAVTTAEDTARAITLAATDADGDPLTFTVTPVNDAPRAVAAALAVVEDTAAPVVLAGVDADGDPLTYAVVDPPTGGTLTGSGASRTYTPASDRHGSDRFTFTVSDGQVVSAPAEVAITVAAVDDAPVASAQAIAATEDQPAAITLAATDGDGEPLTFAVASPPQHGTLSGTAPALSYTPAADYHGADAFTFTATDAGGRTSAPATVAIQVAPVNDPPVATSAAFTLDEDTTSPVTLAATDVDGDALTYTITQAPRLGSLLGTAPAMTYAPVGNRNGEDVITFQVSDGRATSAPATIRVTLTPVPDPPTARDDLAVAPVDGPVEIAVLANDADLDGDALTLDEASAPGHGTVEIDGDHIVYTPGTGQTATTSFTYTIRDATDRTATATVRVGIGEFPNGLPPQLIASQGAAASDGAPGFQHDISADARYVAFVSTIGAGVDQVYLRDRTTLTSRRVSQSATGEAGNGPSGRPSVSADGRYVAFESTASNLVPGDSNGVADVIVRDMQTGAIVRASVSSTGAQGSGASTDPDLSDDGQRVAFVSAGFELTADDFNGQPDIVVRDLATGTTRRVSVSSTGGAADAASSDPALSGDGLVVAFASRATNLVAGDTNQRVDVFVHDLASAVTTRVSLSSTGLEGDGDSATPVVSRDGRFVGFRSLAKNLVSGLGTSTWMRAFVRDRVGGTTTFEQSDVSSLTLSADGRYLAGHLRGGDVFVRDRFAGQIRFLNASTVDVYWPVIAGNGRYLIVLSSAPLAGGTGSSPRLFALPSPW